VSVSEHLMVGSVFATLAGVSVNLSASLLGRFIKCRKEVQKRSAVRSVVSEKIAVSEK
jgi:hypothetical protein